MASHCLPSSHTDMAYREAINRLKHLLSDTSYTPVAHQTTTLYTPFSSTARNQFRDFTKYYPGTNILRATCYSSPSKIGSVNIPSGPKETPPCCKSICNCKDEI